MLLKIPRTLITLLCFVLIICRVSGQADSILSLPKEQQLQALYSWYTQRDSVDPALLAPILDRFYSDFTKKGREDLARVAWSISILNETSNAPATKALEIIDQALSHAINNGWHSQEVDLYVNKGFILRNNGKQVVAFENLMKGYELMQQVGIENIPNAHNLLYKIGISYYYVKAYDQASKYLRQVVTVPVYHPNHFLTTVTYNTLGLSYMRQMKYDSALIAFQKAHDAAEKGRLIAYAGVTSGNIGNVYFKMGDDDKALPFLEEDFRVSVANKQYNSASNASLTLATIYLKKGFPDKAAGQMQFVREHLNQGDDNSMKYYYDNLSDMSRIVGDFKNALMYRDSAFYFKDRIQAAEETDILERARFELELEKHSHEIFTLESQRKRQVLIRNVLLLFVVLGGLTILSLIQRRHLRRKRELTQAQKELTLFTRMVREKNEMLDSFSHEIETLRATDQDHQDERMRHLSTLMNSHILTEDDWNQFRQLFDKVYPGFFARLKQKMPDLTAAETRLLALTKLQLAPREMASMLGISYDSILKSRQRLRKKINLPEEGTLDELLNLI